MHRKGIESERYGQKQNGGIWRISLPSSPKQFKASKPVMKKDNMQRTERFIVFMVLPNPNLVNNSKLLFFFLFCHYSCV